MRLQCEVAQQRGRRRQRRMVQHDDACRPLPDAPSSVRQFGQVTGCQPAVPGAGNGRIQHDDAQPVAPGAPAGSARVSLRCNSCRWNSVRTSWLPVAKIGQRCVRRRADGSDRRGQSLVGVRVPGVGQVAGQHHGVQPPAAAPIGSRSTATARCSAASASSTPLYRTPAEVRWVSDRWAMTWRRPCPAAVPSGVASRHTGDLLVAVPSAYGAVPDLGSASRSQRRTGSISRRRRR